MISCQQYDYIELACLFNMPISLTLIDGTQYSGQACDTRYNAEHRECIVIKTTAGEKLIETDQLHSMKANSPNRHFDVIEFTQSTQ